MNIKCFGLITVVELVKQIIVSEQFEFSTYTCTVQCPVHMYMLIVTVFLKKQKRSVVS